MSNTKPDKRQRLIAAHAALIREGVPVTVRALREKARVDVHAAAEFLREQKREALPSLPESLATRLADAAAAQHADIWSTAAELAAEAVRQQHAQQIAETLELLEVAKRGKAELEAQLADARHEIEQLTAARDDAKAAVQMTRGLHDTLVGELEDIRTENGRLRFEREDLLSRLSRTEGELIGLRVAVAALQPADTAAENPSDPTPEAKAD